jgi:hypothetical protein
MKMRILALVLLALLPVLAVAATYGTKPTIGKGTVTLLSSTIVGSQRTAADNTITTYKNTYSLTGALTGTAVSLERDVFHNSSGRGTTTFHGEANFTNANPESSGTGTLVIHYVGVNNGTFVRGQFVADSGTGSYADFHGQGEFSGKVSMTLALSYTLKWHIDPAVATKSAA